MYELIERYTNLAQRHLGIVEKTLNLVRDTRQEFKELASQDSQANLRERLQRIIKTEENRERILFSECADF